MRFKTIILILLFLSLSFCKSPASPKHEVKPTAVLIITVDRTPILMEWGYYTKLWWMEPRVNVSETRGVGVNVTEAKVEFVYQNRAGYEPQTVEGGRINANQSQNYWLSVGTEYTYDGVRFTIKGNDDNGHSISKQKDFPLHYVGQIKGR